MDLDTNYLKCLNIWLFLLLLFLYLRSTNIRAHMDPSFFLSMVALINTLCNLFLCSLCLCSHYMIMYDFCNTYDYSK